MLSSQTCVTTVVHDLHSTVFEKVREIKGSSLFKYKNPDALEACQKIIEAWTKKLEWKEFKRAEAVIETTRNIIMQDFRAV